MWEYIWDWGPVGLSHTPQDTRRQTQSPRSIQWGICQSVNSNTVINGDRCDTVTMVCDKLISYSCDYWQFRLYTQHTNVLTKNWFVVISNQLVRQQEPTESGNTAPWLPNNLSRDPNNELWLVAYLRRSVPGSDSVKPLQQGVTWPRQCIQNVHTITHAPSKPAATRCTLYRVGVTACTGNNSTTRYVNLGADSCTNKLKQDGSRQMVRS